MKLIDVIEIIDSIDDELIVFQEDCDDFSSDVILANAEEGDEGVENYIETNYFYLLEVFLAKEFIEDWIQSLDYTPSSEEIAKRINYYAINDA